MALIEFQDLPNTTTPINAANLNNNFDELDEKSDKNIITAELENNFTKTTTDYEILPFTTEIKVGTKLTLSNNAVIIGSGVSKIKVSAKASFNNLATSGLKWLTIFKNSDAVSPNPRNLSARDMIYATDVLVSVNENDIITAKVNGAINDVIRGGIGYTCITVEVIE